MNKRDTDKIKKKSVRTSSACDRTWADNLSLMYKTHAPKNVLNGIPTEFTFTEAR